MPNMTDVAHVAHVPNVSNVTYVADVADAAIVARHVWQVQMPSQERHQRVTYADA
jgi:hypothetical protein